MKNRFYYIGLNLFVPGLGQLSAKRYVRGTVQVLASVVAVLWLAAEVMLPFWKFYTGDMLESKLPEIKIISLLMPILLFIVIFLWSIIDLMFGLKKTNCEEKDEES